MEGQAQAISPEPGAYFGDNLARGEAAKEVTTAERNTTKLVSAGPTASLSLHQAVSIAVGECGVAGPFTALSVVGARIFYDDNLVFSGDVDVLEATPRLARVAHGFGVKLELLRGSGEEVLWSSDTPDMWFGTGKVTALASHVKPLTVVANVPSVKAKKEGKVKRIGRPKGSKDKKKRKSKLVSASRKAKPAKRGRPKKIGRPKGSKDKKKRKKRSA